MTPESKAKLEQIKLALKAAKDAEKAAEKSEKADEKAEKEAKKLAYKELIAENKAATTIAKLNAVVDKLLKELSK